MGSVNVTTWVDRKIGAVIAVMAHEDPTDRFECELAFTQAGGKGGDFPNGPVPPAGQGLLVVRPGFLVIQVGCVTVMPASTLSPDEARAADMACVFIVESGSYDPGDRSPKNRMGLTIPLQVEGVSR